MTPSGWPRKRPLHQSNESFHNLQQDHRFHSKEQYSPTSPSKPDCEHSSKSLHQMPLRALLPSLPSSATLVSNGYNNDHVNSLNCSSHSHNKQSYPRFEYILAKIQKWNDHARQKSAHYEYISNKTKQYLCQIQKWNDHARQKSAHYEYMFNKTKQYLCLCFQLLRAIFFELISIKCTCKQKLLFLCIIAISTSSYVYFVKMPIWSYEEEWTRWEEGMQKSVANLIPPLPSDDYGTQMNNYWRSTSDQLEQFPYLKQKNGNLHHLTNGKRGGAWDDGSGASSDYYVVPIPDYELMGRTREKMAHKLRGHAIQSCENYQQYQHSYSNRKHSLPVIGITVANDTPGNRYLRRILHTIDLTTVGSIVITWYDEQTEAQLVGKERAGLSHEVIEQALQEFITRKGFNKIRWDEGFAGNTTNRDDVFPVAADLDDYIDGKRAYETPSSHHTRLADTTSLKLMSRIATSIHQFCIFDDNESKDRKRNTKSTNKKNPSKSTCQNELLILRFPANLGCSTGVNNPLFTHPTAPHWLIANYDIAYPPGVLDAMGKELQKTKLRKPDLAVHTYGYIYGRGKLENPWSNFVMTSCAVAKVGVWDENIFPAYYEDDDYRDRIRYTMGKWMDVIGDPDSHGDAPQYLMDDTHLIRYQTDRNISVAHGPLNADTYLSGTHETMKKVQDEEKVDGFLESLWLWLWGRPQNPFHYESQRWSILKEVSNAEGFFRCKHGALPDAGEHGEDPVRYFGWHERFLLPFVNRTRVSRLRESMLQLDETAGKASLGSHDGTSNPSPWALWHFNATRRKCVHNAANLILSMPPSEERANLTQQFKALCSVC